MFFCWKCFTFYCLCRTLGFVSRGNIIFLRKNNCHLFIYFFQKALITVLATRTFTKKTFISQILNSHPFWPCSGLWCVLRANSPCSTGFFLLYSDKKEKKSLLIFKEIHMGSVAKSYMRKGFLIYEDMGKYIVIYEEAVSHIWLCNRSHLNFLKYEKKNFNFLSYQCVQREGISLLE